MDDSQFVVTLKDVYEELRNVHDSVNSLAPHAATLEDHETRMRSIERWKYAIPGNVILAGVSLYLSVRK